ncbi:MAG: DUF2178 domain-containing protein [Methanomicrobiales archaeon]|nr:DUF2178 domain-containing protein [Methanomicrobiales archaeon]
MKKNGFYLLTGCTALVLLGILWYSVEVHRPLYIEIAFIIAIAVIYLLRRRVEDLIEDERSIKITEQAAVRTFQVFWVVFAAFSIGAVMELFYVPQVFIARIPPTPPPESTMLVILPPRLMGYIQLALLCLMIFLYVGFRIYYARKYGEWETDEE